MRLARSLPFLVLAACVTDPGESSLEQDIVGGTQTSTTEFSVVVGLLHGSNNWFCTGVLVDKDWVLTAASCFDNTNATQIRLDDNTLGDGGGRTINVAEIRKHPSFNPNSNTWSHDVAMLKLAQSVTDRTPAPIRRDAAGVGTSVTQVGFGVNNNNGGNGGVLRSLSTTSVDCARANNSGITNANLMCFDASDGTGSCFGDGGAPAFVGTTRAVAGVGSGGTGSSCTSGLDVYTAVAAELGFIDSLLPVTTTPPSDPTQPPTDNPPTPTDPDEPSDPEDPDDDHRRGLQFDGGGAACSTGGGAGWLAIVGIAFALGRRSKAAARLYHRARHQ